MAYPLPAKQITSQNAKQINAQNRKQVAGQIFSGVELGGFSTVNTIESAIGQFVGFAPGDTLFLIIDGQGTIGTTTETIIACANPAGFGGGKGWWLCRAGADQGPPDEGTFFLLSPGADTSLGPVYQMASNGITMIAIVWRASDNEFLVSINGSPLPAAGLALAPGAPVDATCKTFLGSPEPSLGSHALTSARILAVAIWNVEATTAQAQAATFTQGTRYQWAASVTSSPACVFSLVASQWNGSAASFLTAGSSPITFNVAGAPTLTAAQELRVATTDALYSDSVFSLPQVDGSGYAYTIRMAYARLTMVTDALSVAAETYSTMNGEFPGSASSIGLYVNGTWTQEAQAMATAIPQLFELQPGAGAAKRVEIWEGDQQLIGGTSGPGNLIGTFIQAVRLPLLLEDGITSANSSITLPVPVAMRALYRGDSIPSGFITTVFTEFGLPALIRQNLPAGWGYTSYSIGTDSMFNIAKDDATAAANVALILNECTGTARNIVRLQLMTNCYGFWAEAAASYATQATRMVTGLLAGAAARAIPGFELELMGAINRVPPATEAANASGSTLPDFRAQAVAIAAANPPTIYINGSPIVSTPNYAPDGIHPNNAGQAQLETETQADWGY